MSRDNPLGLKYHPEVKLQDPGRLLDNPENEVNAVNREKDFQNIKSRVLLESFIHRGSDETVDVTDYLLDPTGLGAIHTLVSFTVNIGVAFFDHIAIVFSEPFVTYGQQIGWRLSVNAAQVVNIRNNTTAWRYVQCGDLSDPMGIKPVWVQSGETLSIEITTTPINGVLFDQHLTVMGRLVGRIFKPATPILITGSAIT